MPAYFPGLWVCADDTGFGTYKHWENFATPLSFEALKYMLDGWMDGQMDEN
jgi:hypothetical protein